jgi:hypothetical protein
VRPERGSEGHRHPRSTPKSACSSLRDLRPWGAGLVVRYVRRLKLSESKSEVVAEVEVLASFEVELGLAGLQIG